MASRKVKKGHVMGRVVNVWHDSVAAGREPPVNSRTFYGSDSQARAEAYAREQRGHPDEQGFHKAHVAIDLIWQESNS